METEGIIQDMIHRMIEGTIEVEIICLMNQTYSFSFASKNLLNFMHIANISSNRYPYLPRFLTIIKLYNNSKEFLYPILPAYFTSKLQHNFLPNHLDHSPSPST